MANCGIPYILLFVLLISMSYRLGRIEKHLGVPMASGEVDAKKRWPFFVIAAVLGIVVGYAILILFRPDLASQLWS